MLTSLVHATKILHTGVCSTLVYTCAYSLISLPSYFTNLMFVRGSRFVEITARWMELSKRYLSILKQFLCAVWISIPQQIFTQLKQLRFNVIIEWEVTSIYYGHVQTSLKTKLHADIYSKFFLRKLLYLQDTCMKL